MALVADRVMEAVPAVMRRIRLAMRADVAGQPGTTVPQLRALLFVRRHPGCSLSAMAEHLGMTLPACSGLAERLVRAGLLERTTDPQERRRVQLRLTSDGMERVAPRRPAGPGVADRRPRRARPGGPARPGRRARAARARHRAGGPGMSELAIETRALRRTFKEVTAVESLDLAIPSDQASASWGPTARARRRPSRCSSRCSRRRPARPGWPATRSPPTRPRVRRHIGYVPQLVSADGALTAWRTCSCRPACITCRGPSARNASPRPWPSWASRTPATAWCGPTLGA